MALVRPLVTPEFTSYAGDSLRARILLVLQLFDDFLRLEDVAAVQQQGGRRDLRRQNPLGYVDIKVNGPREIAVIKNSSGFYCITLLEDNPRKAYDGTYRILINADVNVSDHYLPEELGFTIKDGEVDRIIRDNQEHPAPDRRSPVVDIILRPKSAYPFPENATLVRGMALVAPVTTPHTELTPIAEAIVSTTFQQLQFDADDGEYKPKPRTIATHTDEQGEFVLFFKRVAKREQDIVELKAEKNGRIGQVNPVLPIKLREGNTTRVNFSFQN
jgi:hypothetical protein